ncbi:caspase b-like [Onychostoma macrolepis]|nr:caspase b-like [Onychostoma macrolepis]XP_058626888.1 caspase b-like [Onychostoma macrolepis]
MAATKRVICDALEDLLEEDFEKFKWELWNGVMPDITPISRGQLEKAKSHDVVNLMVQQYSPSDAGKIAVRALRNIKQNELAVQLKGKLQEVPEDVSAEGGASSGAAAANASTAGVKQTISNSGGTVKAHVLHGGVFNGPVNFS